MCGAWKAKQVSLAARFGFSSCVASRLAAEVIVFRTSVTNAVEVGPASLVDVVNGDVSVDKIRMTI